MAGFLAWSERRKYELLLFGLVQHLFSAVLVPDLEVYKTYVWPMNMILLGVLSVGIFSGVHGARRALKNIFQAIVVAFPAIGWFVVPTPAIMIILSVSYGAFFLVIFVEVLRFLLRPSYIDADIVSAAACGYLLLLEVGIFVMQALFYLVPGGFHGVSDRSVTASYLDLVYFAGVTVTTIGFGDITATHHMTKLATAMLGICGQFYVVLLVGILIGKYTSASDRKKE